METANEGKLRLEDGARVGPDPNDPMQPAPSPKVMSGKPAVPFKPFESVKLRKDADRTAACSKCTQSVLWAPPSSAPAAPPQGGSSSGHDCRLWAARHS